MSPGRIRLRTLVVLRWLAIAGQTLSVLGVYFALGFHLPLIPCLVAIAASAALNITVSLRFPTAKRLSNREAALYLGFDLVQLFALILLTGGVLNPFTLLFLAPITISATTLDLKSTIALGLLGLVCVSVLAVFHMPLPWYPGETLDLPALYVVGMWTALVLGIGFSAIYAWRVATEAQRMANALEATSAALAREHRLAALGGLAAAAAHELGTPLGTIALVAKELERELGPESPHAEDMALLRAQAARCRDILGELSRRPEDGDNMFSSASVGALLDEVAQPHQGFGPEIVIDVQVAEGGRAAQLRLPRQPELVHGLGNLIENAVDFAEEQVTVTARWTDDRVDITIADDGPGFAPEVLQQLGEPYISTRAAPSPGLANADPDEHVGMGLGFFIAKTLLERTGARVTAGNAPAGGARIVLTWTRSALESVAPQETVQI